MVDTFGKVSSVFLVQSSEIPLAPGKRSSCCVFLKLCNRSTPCCAKVGGGHIYWILVEGMMFWGKVRRAFDKCLLFKLSQLLNHRKMWDYCFGNYLFSSFKPYLSFPLSNKN